MGIILMVQPMLLLQQGSVCAIRQETAARQHSGNPSIRDPSLSNKHSHLHLSVLMHAAMGLLVSKADSSSSAPPPLPAFISQAAAEALKKERVNYLELPAPVKYEDIQREGMMALKPDLFEGMRFELNKPLNPNFFLSHSIFMGNMDLSTGGRQMLKTPMGTYEFGANVITEKFMMLGRITTEGRLSGRVKYDLAQWLALKLHMQLSNEPGQSQGMLDTDVKVWGLGTGCLKEHTCVHALTTDCSIRGHQWQPIHVQLRLSYSPSVAAGC
jgi:hypothetical protein